MAGERAGRKDRCSMRQVGKRDKWPMRFANVRRRLLSSVVMGVGFLRPQRRLLRAAG